MRVSRLAADRKGTVAVTVTLVAACAMGVAALGIDLGALVRAKRAAQGAVDLAAMLAAADPLEAEQLARRSLADNGFANGATIAIASGRYAASSSVVPSQRFQAGAGPLNAVRVDLKTKVKTSFSKVIGLPAEFEVGATGTAATAQMAAFSIGSGLAALDGGIANAVLGALLGTRLSLSAMDYNSLLSTTLDSYRFLDALGARLNLASFDEILAANVGIGDVLLALKTANQGSGSSAAGSAIDAILAAGPTGARLKVGDLIDLGDAGALAPGKGARGPDVGIMDILSAAASLANGRNQVSIDLGARVPGLLQTRLTLSIGEKRQSSGWAQPGTPNATVKTAQTRLLLETELTAPLGLGSVYLPIYVQAAQATATLRSVSCPWSQSAKRQVSIDAQPAVVDLAIANISRSSVATGTAQPDLTRDATLIGLPLISVTGKARATLGSPAAQSLTFTDDDIARRRVKSVSSTGLTQSLTTNLINTLSLNVAGLGLGAVLRPALLLVLSGVAPVLDGVLDTTLRTLGLKIGTVDVTVDGTRCDHSVLVQ